MADNLILNFYYNRYLSQPGGLVPNILDLRRENLVNGMLVALILFNPSNPVSEPDLPGRQQKAAPR